MDAMSTPLPFAPVDGEHVVVYDSADRGGFLRRLKYYLERPAEMRRVARAGFVHCLRHHRAVSRIDWLLRSALEIQRRDAEVEERKAVGKEANRPPRLRGSSSSSSGSGSNRSGTSESEASEDDRSGHAEDDKGARAAAIIGWNVNFTATGESLKGNPPGEGSLTYEPSHVGRIASAVVLEEALLV